MIIKYRQEVKRIFHSIKQTFDIYFTSRHSLSHFNNESHCSFYKQTRLSASVLPRALGDEALLKQLIQKKVTGTNISTFVM